MSQSELRERQQAQEDSEGVESLPPVTESENYGVGHK